MPPPAAPAVLAPSAAPLDPDVRRLLAMLSASGRKPYPDMTVAAARAAYRAGCALTGLPAVPMADVRDLVAEPDGVPPMRLRCYRRNAVAGGHAPCTVYFHGGGWVLGDLDTHDPICRALAEAAGGCVIAVEYRLAPEAPFPAAAEDAIAAYRWIARHATSLGIDAARLSVAGDSAGGNLAAVVSLVTRGGPHAPTAQSLYYPVTDLGGESAGYARVVDGVPLVADTMRWFRGHYLGSATAGSGPGLDVRASPARAPTLAGSPPTFLVTALHDPLREEGAAYAQRLEADGVRVLHLDLSDQIHGFLTLGGWIGAAMDVLAMSGRHLRRASAHSPSVERAPPR